jgi:hypothetical protein
MAGGEESPTSRRRAGAGGTPGDRERLAARARELAQEAAGAPDPERLAAISAELSSIRAEMRALGTNGDPPIATDSPPSPPIVAPVIPVVTVAPAVPVPALEPTVDPTSTPAPPALAPEPLVDPAPDQPRWLGWLLAFVIAATIGAAIVRVMSGYLIPPGQDEGQWIATSYAYVGLPYPSEIVPLAYPPAMFPFLGLLVRVLGGPSRAALAFVGLVTVFLGLASYQLARTLLRSVPLGLVCEATFLLFPSVVRMDFWGGYPTLFGLVFVCLSVTYLNRFFQIPRPWYALVFWVASAIAILSESLVASTLAATLLIMAVLLTAAGARPWRVLLNRGGLVGAAMFTLLVGGFYAATDLAKVPHANYAAASSSAHVLSDLGTFFAPVVGPFGLKATPSAGVTFVALAVLSAAIVLILLATTIWIPDRVNTTDITLGAWTAGVMLLAVAGWVLNVVSVYGRFGYLLILPIVVAVIYGLRILDGAIDERWQRRRGAAGVLPTAPTAGSDPNRPVLARFALAARERPLRAMLVAVVLVGLFVMTGLATVPSITTDERFFAQPGHGSNYTAALHSIQSSNIPGGILVGVPQVGRWPRALILRNTFSPLDPSTLGTQDFYPSKVLDSELAYYALADSVAVTNGLVSASYAGNNSSAITGLPDYEAFYYGHTTPVLRLDPTSINLQLTGGHTASLFDGVPNVTMSGANAGQLTFTSAEPGVSGTIVVTPVVGQPKLVVSLSVTATGPNNLIQVNATLATAKMQGAVVTPGPGTTFSWTPNKNSEMETNGTVSPNTVGMSLKSGGTSNSPRLTLSDRTSIAKGVPSLNMTITLTTQGAQNLIPALPTLIRTTQVWQSLDVSFVLLSNDSTLGRNYPQQPLAEIAYLEGTLGATPFFYSYPWTVLRLPTV